MTDWNDVFRRADRCVYVSNVKPKHETARNIYAEDKKLILEAAEKFGFYQFTPSGATISFVRRGTR